MKQANEGSCVLIVTILSTVMLLYYMNTWQNLVLMDDIVSKKYKYEKQFRNAEALYLYGLTICLNNFDTLLTYNQNNKAQAINIYDAYWPQASNNHGFVKIKFENENEISMEANTLSKNIEVFKITASIIKDTIETEEQKRLFVRFLINNWHANVN